MPSVGMRRTTRVFGVVKGVDGARVLRSGRRLWPDFGEGKLRRANDGEDFYHHQPVIQKHNSNGPGHVPGGLKGKPNNWAPVQSFKLKQQQLQKKEVMDICENDNEIKMSKKVKEEVVTSKDRMFGMVYNRKRKRSGKKSQVLDDKMYGIRFSRRQRRKKTSSDNGGRLVGYSLEDNGGSLRAFGVIFESSCGVRSSGFLSLVLGYMKKARVKLPELASFLLSQPISGVFSSQGIRFLWDPPTDSIGLCKFFFVRQIIPKFYVDFSAVPFCFMHIHRCMLGGLKCLPTVPVNSSVDSDDEIMTDIENLQPCKPSADDVECLSDSKTMVPVVDNAINRVTVHPSVRASKFAGRGVQYRNGLNRAIQKRRSSHRRTRARNPSLVGVHRANGALVSDLICSRKNGIPFSSVVSKTKLRSSVQSSTAVSVKEMSSNMDHLMQDSDLSCCFASILVMESDRCYREEGATVMLEMSASREYLLAVKKDGVTKYTHKAQKIMRPSSFNRLSHAIVWTGDDNWKLEFPYRRDWLNFKDLYKNCFNRNANVLVTKEIPVPGVCEVSGYEDNNTVPFCRPDLYISVHDDEVSRALAKRTAIYDMDSEDEEWLKKFNIECSTENDLHELVSEEKFELIVDAFEKAHYCSPDDYSSETAAVNLCFDLGRQEVVQAVHNYWMHKRKQKQAALLRVFQCRQVEKAPLIPKPVLRKRRSFKRQASNIGRGKQHLLLKANAAERDALEEENAIRKVEKATASASNSMESAIVKRQRAQLLMEYADLETYKAMAALRIAEDAELGGGASRVFGWGMG